MPKPGTPRWPPAGNGSGAAKPVVEMPARPELRRRRPGPAVGWILAGTLTAAALIAAVGFRGRDPVRRRRDSGKTVSDSSTRRFRACDGGPLSLLRLRGAPGYVTATLKRSTVLDSRPGGHRKLARVPPRTE